MDSQVTYPDLSELQDEFGDLETAEERIQFLIELGQSLPEFPEQYCTEEFRVLGCQSMVWIVPRWDGERFHFIATSDAPMVRGLVAVLLSIYSGKQPQEILDIDINALLSGLHLKTFLSPLRSNGLHSMIRRIRDYAESKLAVSAPVPAVDRKPTMNDFGPLQSRIEEIRADFPILRVLGPDGKPVAYLDNGASSQRPKSVIDAICQTYERHYANVHRSGHAWAMQTTELLEASREAVRRYVNAPRPEQILFTAGTTAAINLVAQSWGLANLKAGDEIVLTEMEHHSNIVPWQQLCDRVGCVIRWVGWCNDFTLDMEAWRAAMGPRTKLVAFAAISNVLGTINPVKEMIAAAHAVGAVALVDAAQAVPHGPLDVQDWDADFVAFSGHKMLAASGIGVLYGRKSLLESMPAWQGGGSMIKAVTFRGFIPADLPYKFEAGTPPIADIITFKPAIEYLESLGHERMIEHERMLVQRAMEGLSKIEGIKIFSPSVDQKCGIVSFAAQGVHVDDIAKILDSRGVAVRVGHHCAMPLHERLGVRATCRASFYLYNTIEEVDRLVEGVLHAMNMLKR